MTHPHLERLFAGCRDLWRQDPELQRRFPDVTSLGYWQWLLGEGLAGHPDLLALLPLPPLALIGRVRGNASAELFNRSGLSDGWNLLNRLVDGGFDLGDGNARLLDFGCGCGRLLRVFARIGDSVRLAGCDVDADAVAWCRDHLPFADVHAIGVAPPSPFADDSFDGVFSYSVFSHLPERLHLDWLAELRRVTRPGAVVVLTTHGRHCADVFARGEGPVSFPPAELMRAHRATLERDGFLYLPYTHSDLSLPEADRDRGMYGMTWILDGYIRAHWLDGFELLRHETAPEGWQDFITLRRR